MQHLMNKVEEMKQQRLMLANQLRESICQDDITRQVVTYTGECLQTLFQQELQKHQRYVQLIEQNLAAQENILKAVKDAYARYGATRKLTAELYRRRESMIASLISSYDAYEDLIAKSAKGLDFYKKLETNVTKLLQRVKGTCKVQDEERVQMMKSVKGADVTTPTPSLDNPPAPAASGGLKLKDYLNMKKETGKLSLEYPSTASVNPYYNASEASSGQNWVPSIRPAPVGSEETETSSKIKADSFQNYNPNNYYQENQNYDDKLKYYPYSNATGQYQTSQVYPVSNPQTNPDVKSNYYSNPVTSYSDYNQATNTYTTPPVNNTYMQAGYNYQTTGYSEIQQYSNVQNSNSQTNFQSYAYSSNDGSYVPQSTVGYTMPDYSSYVAPVTSSYVAPVTSSYVAPVTSSYVAPSANNYVAPNMAANNYVDPVTNSYASPEYYQQPTDYIPNQYTNPVNYTPNEVPPWQQTYPLDPSSSIPYSTYPRDQYFQTGNESVYTASATPNNYAMTNSDAHKAQEYPNSTYPNNYYTNQYGGYAEQEYNSLDKNQMTYMVAGQDKPQAVTNTTFTNNDAKSSPSANCSNVDLLAGLDFNINQSPLVPEPKKDEVKVEKVEMKPTEVVKVEEKKILEVTELSIKKEEEKGNAVPKEMVLDGESLKQFVGEVEKYEKFVEGLTSKTLNGPTCLDLKWKELTDLQVSKEQ